MNRKTSRRDILKIASMGLSALVARFTIFVPESALAQSSEPPSPLGINESLRIKGLHGSVSYQQLTPNESAALYADAILDTKYRALVAFLGQGNELVPTLLSSWQMVADGVTSRVLLIQLRQTASDQVSANLLWSSSKDQTVQSPLIHVAAADPVGIVFVPKSNGEIEVISHSQQTADLSDKLAQLQAQVKSAPAAGSETTTADCSVPCAACAFYASQCAFWTLFCLQGDPFACALAAVTCGLAGNYCYECDRCNRCGC